ncbi:UNVERIFIED_CONTAM: Pleiotropic drug resistance protein 1 [Sesamum radiatum]|uniref:Pleiotropic drug resistance protein 1 n=1 Tax=Sesamum radiatum TaxID=300843 RepID=A0AAW2MHF4_SESRA
MDEPTSGLDARAAAIVMRTVRNTVDTGRTVVCTIHQPSIDIFDAFDELLLLKRGGEEIYVGPLGRHSSQLIKYFEGIDGISKIKDGYNPATWMLEVTSEAQEAALGVNFAEVYKNSELYRRNKALIKELSTPAPVHGLPMETTLVVLEKPPIHCSETAVYNIHSHNVWNYFWDLGSKRKKKQDVFNAMGSMYAAVLFLGVQNATSVQPVVAIERTVFYEKEQQGCCVELPNLLIQTLVYGVIVYAMIGFEWTVAKFLWYLFFMYFTLLYFTLYGMMTVAVTPNHNIAAIISSAFYALWNLFSGFIIPKTRIPVWWRWYYYVCPISWTLYGLVASQFGDIKSQLDDNDQTVEEFVRNYFGFRHDFVGYVAVILLE